MAMLFGDRRPHLVALIVPRDATIEAFLDKHNIVDGALAAIADNPEFRGVVEAAIDRINARLPQPERVRKFIVAREPFSVRFVTHNVTFCT